MESLPEVAATWPNFFIGGAPRSGTTSLYEYLRQHPEVFMSPVKEPGYFSPITQAPPFSICWRPVRDVESYLGLFSGASGYKAVGEATPTYLFDPSAADLIARQVPHAKFIFLLRDPIEQSYSHYWCIAHKLRFHPYEQVLRRDDWNWYLTEPGKYADHLNRFFGLFPRDHIRVFTLEELSREPQTVLKGVSNLLNIDPSCMDAIDTGNIHNRSVTPRNNLASKVWVWRKHTVLRYMPLPNRAKGFFLSQLLNPKDVKPKMKTDVRQRLLDIYGPQIEATERLLGRSLPELRKSWQTT